MEIAVNNSHDSFQSLSPGRKEEKTHRVSHIEESPSFMAMLCLNPNLTMLYIEYLMDGPEIEEKQNKENLTIFHKMLMDLMKKKNIKSYEEKEKEQDTAREVGQHIERDRWGDDLARFERVVVIVDSSGNIVEKMRETVVSLPSPEKIMQLKSQLQLGIVDRGRVPGAWYDSLLITLHCG
jgi:hypothetical protein